MATQDARALVERHGRKLVLEAVRSILAAHRRSLGPAGAQQPPSGKDLMTACAARLEQEARPSLRPVFNLTGTVLHTNLGRAQYAEQAVAAAAAAMRSPVNLEYELAEGERGERDSHVEALIVQLTGAEAALVVNNNAAAVYLTLNTLAASREVIVSRGELVEIGGSFRVPEIMASSGCLLREVGTTNRTHPGDFENAIGPATGAVMKVHASNYRIEGFTCNVCDADLAGIARSGQIPFINDLGAGMLVDLERWGLPHEPTAQAAVAAGADVVTFSGDKLLGGPQCGFVVGRKALVDRMRRNPMKRALRLDKVRIAALEATLRLYLHPELLGHELPTLRMLIRPQQDIEAQANRLLAPLARALEGHASVRVVACASQIGSGALPTQTLPSAALAIEPGARPRTLGADGLARLFRSLPVPVVGRIHAGALLLDLRCLHDEPGFLAQLDRLDP